MVTNHLKPNLWVLSGPLPSHDNGPITGPLGSVMVRYHRTKAYATGERFTSAEKYSNGADGMKDISAECHINLFIGICHGIKEG